MIDPSKIMDAEREIAAAIVNFRAADMLQQLADWAESADRLATCVAAGDAAGIAMEAAHQARLSRQAANTAMRHQDQLRRLAAALSGV